MKKILSVAILAGLMAFTVGCGGTSSSAPAPAATKPGMTPGMPPAGTPGTPPGGAPAKKPE